MKVIAIDPKVSGLLCAKCDVVYVEFDKGLIRLFVEDSARFYQVFSQLVCGVQFSYDDVFDGSNILWLLFGKQTSKWN